jgi:cytochrome P450
MTTPRTLPGPKRYPIVGSLPDLAKDPMQFLFGAQRQHGDRFYYQMMNNHVYFLAHPDDIKHVLQDNHQNYYKHKLYGLVKPLIGEGLLTSEGETWLTNRRLIQPVFHRQRIAGFAEMMQESTVALIETRLRTYHDGRAFDLLPEMMRLTLTVVARALFSRDISGDADEVGRALSYALEFTNRRIMSAIPVPLSVPTPANQTFQRALETLDGVVLGMIQERRQSAEEQDDLLGMLLSAQDADTGEGMSDRQVRDEAMTLFLAGHETSAAALTWLFYLLSRHVAVYDKLKDEIAQVLQGRAVTLDDLPQLGYTRMVIDETLRLYPPAWMIGRYALRDDMLPGKPVAIPAGTNVSVSPYVTHRHSQFWDNPEGFEPERFSPERAKGRHRYAYFPFAGGPRQCIGNTFALMEMTIIVATLMQHLNLELVSGQTVIPDPGITMRPKGGLLMRLRRV